MPEEARTSEITLAFLDAFADAWNRHDVDAIMSAITEDCVFEASAGVVCPAAGSPHPCPSLSGLSVAKFPVMDGDGRR